MNGFRIRRRGANGAAHHFVVSRHPALPEVEVVVVIGREALDRVQRLAGLAAASGFWAVQAERTLANHLWREGQSPESGRLEVTEVSREDLDVASVWQSD